MAAWRWRRRRLRLALAAVCLGMLGVIVAEMTTGGGSTEPSAAAAGQQSPADAAFGFTMPPASAFSAVLARPLFSPTRRPGAQAGGLATSSSFTLVAIIIAPQDRRALLGFGQPPKIVRVREGQDVGGWTVEAIRPNNVIVRHADVREEVKAGTPTGGSRAAPAASTVISGARKPPPHRPAHDD